jgi:uncharacterized protein (TIGR00725 family)
VTAAGSKDSGLDVAYVAVIGPGKKDAGKDDIILARKVGRELARRGAVLVCGGLKGVMQAASEGAREGSRKNKTGRQVIGLLPGKKRCKGNPYLSAALPTGLGELRNGLLVGVSDAVIAVGCSWGTLNEIALAMRISKPTVLISRHDWEIRWYRDSEPAKTPFVASSPREAVEVAMREIADGKARSARAKNARAI